MTEPPVGLQPETDSDSPVIIAGQPYDPGEHVLAERFFERMADQSQQMDELARQMIAVELAVPGLYASILALTRGQSATLPAGPLLWLTFGCWFIALAVTFVAFFPRKYRVDPTILRGDPDGDSETLGLEDFFNRSAAYKRRLLAVAALIFWAGIAAAVGLLFG
jgi:hypothetical protein